MEEKNDEAANGMGRSSSSDMNEAPISFVAAAAAVRNGNGDGGRKEEQEEEQAMDVLASLTTISTRGSMAAASAAASTTTTTRKGPAAAAATKKSSLPESSLTLVAATATTTRMKETASPILINNKHSAQRRGKKATKPRRGSSSSLAAALSTAAGETGVPGPQQQQRRRQASASGAATATINQQQHPRRKQRKLPVIVVASDENPHRLVNPLTEWPPPSAAAQAAFASAAAAAAAGTTSPSDGTGGDGTTAGISPTNINSDHANFNNQACELLPLQDIFHPLPDTYSIAYTARLLGFQIPPPPLPDAAQNNNYINNYKPVPLPSNLELERDDGYQTIPRRGTFVDAIYKNGKRHVHAATNDADDCRTLDVLDPLYEALLLLDDTTAADNNAPPPTTAAAGSSQDGGTTMTTTTRPLSAAATASSLSSSSLLLPMTKPVTAAHQQRLLQAGTFSMAWSDTLQLARTYMQVHDDEDMKKDDNDNDDTVLAGTASATVTTTTAAAGTTTCNNNNSPTASWKVSTLADFQREQQQQQQQQQEKPNPPPPPSLTTTTSLPEFLTNSKPVANECGIFLWNNTESNNNDSTIGNNCSDDNATEATPDSLVGVALYQFAWYCHGNNQAGVVLSIRDIYNAQGVSCLDENNYTVIDDNEQQQQQSEDQEQRSAAAEAPPLSLPRLLLLTSLVLQHARAAQVWYVTLLVPSRLQGFFATFFRMVPSVVAKAGVASSTTSFSTTSTPRMVRMVCDLNKCSTRYAFLIYQQFFSKGRRCDVLDMIPPKEEEETMTTTTTPFRALVRLPNVDEVRIALKPPNMVAPRSSNTKRATNERTNRTNSSYFTSAPNAMRHVAVGVRAQFSHKPADDDDDDNDEGKEAGDEEDVWQESQKCSLLQLDPVSRKAGAPIDLPPFYAEPSLEILKTFPLVQSPLTAKTEHDGEDSDLLQDLVSKQQQVTALETGIEPSLRRLLNMVVEERIEYESAQAVWKRNEERRILEENRQMLERRKAKDMEEQERLETDMDAVCSICLDGEVTPSNQILFCETCNVAVHQYCYGIERVPEGDYFCLACRPPTIDEAVEADSGIRTTNNESPSPIVCELCPLKGGAFIQSQYVPQDTEDEAVVARKWVHVVCAKWLGLNFVDNDKPDLVEDVTDLKRAFRGNNIKCELCQGERGCMNKCRHETCEKWMHVTCARASKICQVVHGEDCHGDVELNPWTLTCPEHAESPPGDVPKDAIPIKELVEMARALPPEPAPLPTKIIPFNKAKGHERKRLLADPEYERKLLIELTTKITANHFVGVRCQVCDQLVESNTVGKDMLKCNSCLIYFCPACKLDVDDGVAGNYKCPSCQFVDTSNAVELKRPSCVACYCKNGPLRPGVAKPVKMTHWNKHPKEFERSLYGKNKLWVHSLCAFWNAQLFFSVKQPGHVDFSDVVMSHGRSFVTASTTCGVCGLSGGLKVKCDVKGCMCIEGESGKHIPAHFHPTCARQAGLEVSSEDDNDGARCYIRCYRHGGNENNLRAKLEDLIEIEKIRCGKTMKTDKPMTFSDASRLLHASIVVMRILGWSWRWAEWWVDYNSSWEPLLEEGEREDRMTKEQLKIVDSTRESRCRDARNCRLAAFGAALRNRMYDRPTGGFDRQALDRALRAVLNTPSLVGPLKNHEIEFFVDWLGRAYRSRSVLLQLGDNKNDVANDGVCVHLKDKSPKYELGNRPVPGKRILGGREIFEKNVDEIDDFMLLEVLKDDAESSISRPSETGSSASQSQPAAKRRGRPRKTPIIDGVSPVRKRKRSKSRPPEAVVSQEVGSVRKRGRPPTKHLKQAITATECKAEEKTGDPPTQKRIVKSPQFLVHEKTGAESLVRKRRRGRPPWKHLKTEERTAPEEAKRVKSNSPESPVRKRPGRPKSISRELPPPPPPNSDVAQRRSPRSQTGSSPIKETEESKAGDNHGDEEKDTSPPVPPPRKRRGRPPRNRPEITEDAAEDSGGPGPILEAGIKRDTQQRESSSSAEKSSDPSIPNDLSEQPHSTYEAEESNADVEDPSVPPPRRRGRPPRQRLRGKPPKQRLESSQDAVEAVEANDSQRSNVEAGVEQSGIKHYTQQREFSSSAEKATGTCIVNQLSKKPPPINETGESNTDAEDSPVSPPRKRRRGEPPKHREESNKEFAGDPEATDSPGPHVEAAAAEKSTSPSSVDHVSKKPPPTKETNEGVDAQLPQPNRDSDMAEQNQPDDGEDTERKGSSGPSVEGAVAQSAKVERGTQKAESSTTDQSANSRLSKPGESSTTDQWADSRFSKRGASAARLRKESEAVPSLYSMKPSCPRKESETVPSLCGMVRRRRAASFAAGPTDGSNDDTKPMSLGASSKDESKPVDTEGSEKSEKASTGASPSIESDASTQNKDAPNKSGKSKIAAEKDSESSGDAQDEDVDSQNEDTSETPTGTGNTRGRPRRSCVHGQSGN